MTSTPLDRQQTRSDSITSLRDMGAKIARLVGLSGSAVGVRLISDQGIPPGANVLKQHRYCQALARARRGENVLLTGEGIACPAAASAFGFRSLPEGLQSGKGLVGFGIVSDAAVGRKMFEGMARLDPNSIHALHLYPLEQAEYLPDVVVVEDEVEKLMWISLAYLNATSGERISSSTAILQATCVDSTIIPYLENRLNISYGCYGCRDATDMGHSETVLGFPGDVLPALVTHLAALAEKAIPTSRGKTAWAALQNRTVQKPDVGDG